MVDNKVSIDDLIEIVAGGGSVKTGVDVYNRKGTLLIDKDVVVNRIKTLQRIKESGIRSVPVNSEKGSGIWDKDGNLITRDGNGTVTIEKPPMLSQDVTAPDPATNDIEKKLYEIEEIKQSAKVKYREAKENIKKVLGDIKNTGGFFDYNEVESNVKDLVEFLTVTENPFSYLTKELFTYDDYLYNHSVNVCAIGNAILNRFNSQFSSFVGDLLKSGNKNVYQPFEAERYKHNSSFVLYQSDELVDISLGFFLHDLGKIMVSGKILNKEGGLSEHEFTEVRKHSFEYGISLLEKNSIKNSIIYNIVKLHHAPLFENEKACYPADMSSGQIPMYVKICKLADIYDAMTSKRCYKDAFNPINVVTELFRKYAWKDSLLQFILHSFVKSVGIYPPGSIVYMRNGQMAYVLESQGPLILPFTDRDRRTLSEKPDPIDAGDPDLDNDRKIENRKSVKAPAEVYELLPPYIRAFISKNDD